MLYAFVRLVFRLAWPVLFRWRCTGTENLPATGPALLCANHRAWADPVSLAIACRRQVHYMAKGELFGFPPLASLFRMVGAFPVRRGKPDRAALRQSFRVLERGRLLGVFPEGTRSRTGRLGPPEQGAALLAARSGAPVVPAAIIGDYRLGSSLSVHFGRPFRLPPPPDGKARPQWLARQSEALMGEIRLLLEANGGLVDDLPGESD